MSDVEISECTEMRKEVEGKLYKILSYRAIHSLCCGQWSISYALIM